MSLPTKKSIPITDLSQYLVLIYGRPGVGKTTLAAQFENPLFLMFEPGAKSLSLYKKDISSWNKFRKTIDELGSETHQYKTVVIDTFSQAYEYCSQYICNKFGWEHPQDGPYGKGWDEVYREFSSQMTRLMSTLGVVLICHATEKDVEQLDGTTLTQIAPDTKGQSMRFLSRVVDVIAYYYYAKNGARYIRIKDNGDVMAKNRIDGHFIGISKFNAGEDPKEAYRNFVRAFNNELEVKENNHEGRTKTNSKNSKGLLFKR